MQKKISQNVSRAGKTGDRGDHSMYSTQCIFWGDFEQPDIILSFENEKISLLFLLSLLTFINIVICDKRWVMCTYHKFDHCSSCANKHKIYVKGVFLRKKNISE